MFLPFCCLFVCLFCVLNQTVTVRHARNFLIASDPQVEVRFFYTCYMLRVSSLPFSCVGSIAFHLFPRLDLRDCFLSSHPPGAHRIVSQVRLPSLLWRSRWLLCNVSKTSKRSKSPSGGVAGCRRGIFVPKCICRALPQSSPLLRPAAWCVCIFVMSCARRCLVAVPISLL